MRGNPKYNYGDLVEFECDGIKVGAIAIVDRFGTFADPSDVSYDIFVSSENCLYKHCNEKWVIKKIGWVPEEEVWSYVWPKKDEN